MTEYNMDAYEMRTVSPDGRYYAFQDHYNGVQRVWIGEMNKTEPQPPSSIHQTLDDIQELCWPQQFCLTFAQRDNNDIVSVYKWAPSKGIELIAKHDYEQLVASMATMVKGIYNSNEYRDAILGSICGHPVIYNPFFKIDTELRFQYYDELKSEDKGQYLFSMCCKYVLDELGRLMFQPDWWQKEAGSYLPHEREISNRSMAIRDEMKLPYIWLNDIPKHLIPRGSKAVSLIFQSILDEFPNRVARTKKLQRIQRVHLSREAYLFPCKEQEEDVLWVSYDQERCRIKAGFGTSNIEISYGLSFDFGFPWASHTLGYQVLTINELEVALKILCSLLKLVYPFHRSFFEEYKKVREAKM